MIQSKNSFFNSYLKEKWHNITVKIDCPLARAGIRGFRPSILGKLGKFKGKSIVLSSKPFRIKNSDAITWENKSLCSRLIQYNKNKRALT